MKRIVGAWLVGIVIGFGSLAATTAQAGEEIGFVKSTEGAVTVMRSGAPMTVAAGDGLRLSDTIVTGADGAIGMTMRDNTVVSLGPNSELSLAEFAFDSTTMDGAFEAALDKGTLTMISGEIVKNNPGAIKVDTPMGILGVRGTKFAVEVAAVD